MIKIILVSALMLGISPLVHAHGDGPCAKDRETLCKGVEQGEGRIHKCMKENKEKLSAECKAHVESMKDKMKDMKEACHDDAEKFCGDVKHGHGRMMKCMSSHKDELSAACKETVKDAKEMRKRK